MSNLAVLSERLATLEARFGTVNLGSWSNDQDVPIWLAMRINPAEYRTLQSSVVSAVQLTAQARGGGDARTGESSRFVSDVLDEWCGTKVPGHFPPRPHWFITLGELGRLAETYPSGSSLREAAFDLGRRLLDRANELGKPTK
jgi:hypothetical protein